MAVTPLPESADPPEAVAIREVVALIDRATEPLGFDLPQHVLRATGALSDPDTWEFELVMTGGRSITDALIGYTAPADCWAIGGLTGGWTAPGAYDEHEAIRGRFVVGRRPTPTLFASAAWSS